MCLIARLKPIFLTENRVSNNINSIYWTSHFSKTQPIKNTAKKADEWLTSTFQRPVYFYWACYMNRFWFSGPPMTSSNHSGWSEAGGGGEGITDKSVTKDEIIVTGLRAIETT